MVEGDLRDVEYRLNTHELVCAERYETIKSRLSRLEGILLSATGVMIVALVGIAWGIAVQ
jgi:hypothetical protein